MLIRLILSVFLVIPVISYSQDYPITQLYSFDYTIEGDSLILDQPQYLSAFNRLGYNNQPSFFSPYEIYLTTNMYDDSSTDIVKINIRNESLYRVTETVESEFSPTPSPDPAYFSCVRIERDGKDQSLWLYPVNRSSYGRRLLEKLDNIGYHIWLSDNEVGLFLVGSPHQFAIANVKSGIVNKLLENIGRCFRINDNDQLLFVHKITEDNWYIKSYDLVTKKYKIITETLPGSEDFELLNDGSILMGNGSKLYRFIDTGVNAKWTVVQDLSILNINNISRMAISESKLLMVNSTN